MKDFVIGCGFGILLLSCGLNIVMWEVWAVSVYFAAACLFYEEDYA